MSLRRALAYETFPALMGGFVWLAVWGLDRGYDPDQRFPSWVHYFAPTVQLHHNLHHAMDRGYQDSNYSGSTAIWDVLFGTFSHPRCPLGRLGIERSPVPAGFAAQLLFPFRSQLRPPELAEEPESELA